MEELDRLVAAAVKADGCDDLRGLPEKEDGELATLRPPTWAPAEPAEAGSEQLSASFSSSSLEQKLRPD